jgi:uncharacterized membrane protein
MFRRADVFKEQLRSGIWPVPLAMMLVGLGLFRLMLWMDAQGPHSAVLRTWWLTAGSGDDARNLLSTLVAAMITMASLVFTITVVALSVAASQFGSRLVRSFVKDMPSKFTLGLFAMTILYCLLGLRVVGTEMPFEQVPHLTVSLGLLLSLVCVFAMLLFVHMVAQAIVADEVIRRVTLELEQSIALLPHARPDRAQQDGSEPVGSEALQLPATPFHLLAAAEGYIEAIRYGRLLKLAQEHDAYVNLHVMAGQFVARDDLIGTYARAQGADPGFQSACRDAVLIGPERTPVQDIAYSLRHLLDIGMRSLSAAINDNNTALVVIDRLRGAFTRLLRRELPSGRHVDAHGVLRVAGPRHSHADHIHHALHALRHSAAAQPVVVIALIDALAQLMPHAQDEKMRRFLVAEAELLAEAGIKENQEEFEQRAIARTLERARAAHDFLQAGASPGPSGETLAQ